MNNSMTERRIHDPQCEGASAGREEVEFSTGICRERYEKGTSDKKKVKHSRERLENQKQNPRGQSGRNNVHKELSRVRYEEGTSDKEQ